MNPKLETERLRLRLPRIEDAPDLLGALADPEVIRWSSPGLVDT